MFFNSTPTRSKRVGSGVVILVIYWILFIMVTSSFIRMLWTIYRTPGFIERGSHNNEQNGRCSTTIPERLSLPPPMLEQILSKDVFVCQPDGMPRWCSTCEIWRPDRSRHCREKDRCVSKPDHFCPWVGGIVSENSMKYFILFNSYTFIYTIFDWILAAVLVAQRDRQSALDGNLVAMLILGLFFMGLTGGIGFSAILNALTNHTTVENTAEPSGHVWTLAIRVAEGQVPAGNVRTITFPSMGAKDPDTLHSLLENEKCSPSTTPSIDDNTSYIEHGRTFAIVTSDILANPWDCGKLENWCQVMGHSIPGWFVPIQVGHPWFSHQAYTSGEDVENGTASPSFFPTSVDVQVMKARAGLAELSSEELQDYETRLENRRNFPYLLGGAGAPRVCA
jgi:palmitoyltransferase